MASPQSLRRIARLAEKLEREMKGGGMAYPWKSLFRTNAILTRIVAHLAEHLAAEAEGRPAKVGRASLAPRTRISVDS